jgi:hypothetical protein
LNRAFAQTFRTGVGPGRATKVNVDKTGGRHESRNALKKDDPRRLVEGYVEHYNNIRLNSAVGYITPKDVLAGRQAERNEGTNAENNLKG